MEKSTIKTTQAELTELIRLHALWLKGAGGARLDLRLKDLVGLDMSGANMQLSVGNGFVSFAGFGAERRQTLFSPSLDLVFCGCFKGTLAKFKEQVTNNYPDAGCLFRRQYYMIISNMELILTFPK